MGFATRRYIRLLGCSLRGASHGAYWLPKAKGEGNMKFRDETLLKIYRKRGMTEEEAQALLKKVRSMPPVDPGMTPPCIDNAADDSYFANRERMK